MPRAAGGGSLIPEAFSSRIALVFSAVVAALLLASAWLVESRTLTFHEEEVERRLDAVASATLGDARAAFGNPAALESFRARVAPIAAHAGLRVTLIRRDGEVLDDTQVRPPLANHRDRPEFVAAMATGRGISARDSRTTSESTFYLARRIDPQDPATSPGALRIATTLVQLDAEIGLLKRTFVFGALAVIALGALCAFVLSRVLARPLETIAGEAAAVAAGKESRIIHVEGPREVRRLADAINAMGEELRSRLASIERARAETEAILESLREGVIAVSTSERLLRMNPAAARLLGLEQPLPPGEALWLAVRFPELEVALRRVIAGEESVVVDASSPADDGSVIALTVTPLAQGTYFGGAVAILSDVTAIRRLESVRSDFVANVSHEMRTPLAVIMGALETLNDPTLGDVDQRRFLEMAQANAARMRSIVEDLLELSKIEAESDAMALEPLNLEMPVRSAANALVLAADAKKILLTVEDPPHTPIVVHGNAKRLEQVFTNLIDNAIKYTPEGGAVRVRFAVTDREASVEVEDTGIGIPAHSIARVFERFYRVDKGRSRDMGGTGLGLAIVKHAARAHGGRVTVRSEEGSGTTFIVTLPRAGAPGPAGAASQASGAGPGEASHQPIRTVD